MPVQSIGWQEPLAAPQGTRWDPPWTGSPSITGSLTPTLIQTGTMETHGITSPAHVWNVGGNQDTQRKSTQTWEECANSTQTVVPLGINFFLNIIT